MILPLLGISALGLWALPASAQHLAHRWSFNSLADSIGGADATLKGNASLNGGKLVLPGGGTRAHNASLPIGPTIAATKSISLEAWFTLDKNPQTWSKLWMFGTSASSYMDFTPNSGISGAPPSASFKSAGKGEITTRATPNPPTIVANDPTHVVVVYDHIAQEIRIYLNGSLADSGPWQGLVSDLGNTPLNYLGSAVGFGDPDIVAHIDEMRIWTGAMSAAQVAANDSAGPDTIPTRDPIMEAQEDVIGQSVDTATIKIPVRNSGALAPLEITGASISGMDADFFDLVTSMPLTIAVGQTADIELAFDPDGLASEFHATLNLETNDPWSPLTRINLVWRAGTAVLEVPAVLNFGPVANTAGIQTYQIPVANTGTAPLEIFDAQIIDTTPPFYAALATMVDDLFLDPVQLAMGETGSVSVAFDPSLLSPGIKPVHVQLISDDPFNPQLVATLNIEVTGAAPASGLALQHRWSFDDLTDSVGGADATLRGDAILVNGSLLLPSGASRTNCASVPIGLTIARNQSMTVESWFTISAH